jgi:hypothetical protein
MAKITAYIPEPTQEYSPDNQRQVLQALDTIKNQLNFSYQADLREEVELYNWFLIGTGRRVNNNKNSNGGFAIGQTATSREGSVTINIVE